MKNYQLVFIPDTTDVDPNVIKCTTTGSFIPCSQDNRHYQEYLEWVAEGNTPDPAE